MTPRERFEYMRKSVVKVHQSEEDCPKEPPRLQFHLSNLCKTHHLLNDLQRDSVIRPISPEAPEDLR